MTLSKFKASVQISNANKADIAVTETIPFDVSVVTISLVSSVPLTGKSFISRALGSRQFSTVQQFSCFATCPGSTMQTLMPSVT